VKNQYWRVFALILMIVLLGSSLSTAGTPVIAQDPLLPGSEKGTATVTTQPAGDGPWVVRAYYADRRLVDELAAWIEPWEVHHDQGYLVVAVTRDEYERMVAAGFRLEVDVRLTEELTQPRVALPGQVNGIPGYPCYRTVEETYATAQAIVAAHPTLASWIYVGDSWEQSQPGGNPGYDMRVLRLTNSAIPGRKPKLFVMSAIHAREYATAELVTRFAEYLVDNYGTDPDATWLLDYHEVHLMLQANPDGRKIAETGLLWRKNTDNDDGCSSSSSWGTDLNRNFEFQWGCCGGSSTNACSETYRGPSPASEPEVQAVEDYIRAEFPDQRGDLLTDPAPADATGVFLDIHSYSELVLWPWGFTATVPPNGTALQTLGRKFAYWNGYSPEQAIGLYPTDGTTDDFAYGDLGVAAYTFEVGTTFFQSCSTFENVILPDNLPALIYAAKVARTPYLTPAGPDALNLAAMPGGVVPGVAVHLTATMNDTRYNNSNGTEPTQNIAAAEYYIDIPPWVTNTTPISYPMTAVDGSFNATVEAVEATIDTTGLSSGPHIVFVRGQDAAGNWGAVSGVFVYLLEPGVAPVIEGYVREAASSLPLTATVSADLFQVNTDPATGYYSMTVISGTYDISAVASGHAISTVTGITVHDYQTIQQDFFLQPTCEIMADDMESGGGKWSHNTAQGVDNWTLSTAQSHSPAHSWFVPDDAIPTDSFLWTTTPIALNGDTMLTFWHRYQFEGTSWDGSVLEISTDGGGSWTDLGPYIKANGYNGTISPGYQNPLGGRQAWTGDLTTWTQVGVDLSAFTGQSVQVRWRIGCDVSMSDVGWYIDDVLFLGSGAACTSPLAPRAEFTSNSPVMLGSPITFFNATTGWVPIDYSWDFGDNLGTSVQTNPSYTYLSTGTFTVTLVATNTVGSDSVSHPVVVLPFTCVEVTGAQLSLVPTGTIYLGDAIDFSADIMPDAATKPYTYTISAGVPLTDTDDPLDFSLTFNTTGTHTVEISVWNCAMTVPVTSSLEVGVMSSLPRVYLPLITKH
jgi:carboxypeptidase T